VEAPSTAVAIPTTTSETTTTDTTEAPEIEIHRDERGRRYSYNNNDGETKWVDDDEFE
jgi:hypothetical protein